MKNTITEALIYEAQGLKDDALEIYKNILKPVSYTHLYGLSEIVAVFTAILMHLKFKNALLSIVVSTGIYMLLIRIF